MNQDDYDFKSSFFFEKNEMDIKKNNLIRITLKDILDDINVNEPDDIPNKDLEDEFKLISDKISYIPSVKDILLLSISHDEKTQLIEKLLVLMHLPVMSIEFFDIKNSIMSTIQSNRLLIEYNNYNNGNNENNKNNKNTENNKILYENIIKNLIEDTNQKPIEYRINEMNIDIADKIHLYSRYKTLSNYTNVSPGYSIKISNWIETIFQLPTENKLIIVSNIKDYLLDIYKKLDEKIYGLDNVKERLLMLLHRRLLNNSNYGTNIALSGPPGVAKTTIINTFAQIIDVPFFQINAASMKEVSFLIGHNFTYENSGPGCIVQALIKMGYKNGIIYFDEFDKIPIGSELSKVLLHITDASQNSRFHDQYIGERFNIDLSQIWFIYSINNKNDVDKTLIDRINVIEIEGYSLEEQVSILTIHILPKLLKENNLSEKSIIICPDIMRYIINAAHKNLSDDQRKGVRQASQLLEDIITKISFLMTMSEQETRFSFHIHNMSMPITLSKEHIDDLVQK